MSLESVTPDRNEETGQYSASYSDDDFLEAIADLGGTAGTSEIAGHVGCVRDSAYRRLNQLAENGRIERRRIGNSLVWSTIGET